MEVLEILEAEHRTQAVMHVMAQNKCLCALLSNPGSASKMGYFSTLYLSFPTWNNGVHSFER